MNSAYVKSWQEGGVGYVEFYHPQSNSLPSDILDRTARAITEAGKNENILCIVLKSGGEKAFCAGASFDELSSIKTEEEGLMFFSGFAKVINAIRLCPKFVLGRVQGKAVGGGVGLASAVDFCFATKTAQVKLSELAVGIGPFVVGPAVERKVGKSAFAHLAIEASEWQSPQWAKECGLFNYVLDNIEILDQSIHAFTEKICSYSPEAMYEIKKILWEGTENWSELLIERAQISGRLVLSDFTRNAINKFKIK